MKPTVAIDLGGTNLRAALVSPDGTLLQRERISTPIDHPDPGVIAEMVTDLVAHSDGRSVEGAVIGVPGIVDRVEGRLTNAPNLPPSWLEFLTSQWLSERAGVDVHLANDADLAAIGEARFGGGRGSDDVVYVTISTGVGAGVVSSGRLVGGRFSGGELGHTVVDRRVARDGGDGTVEGQGSGTALELAMRAAGIEGDPAALLTLVRSGDVAASRLFTNGIEAVGVGVANLCWLVAPSTVVIGGGVGLNGDLVLPIIESCIDRFGPGVAPVKVCNAVLGDDAALVGAAGWWNAATND